MYTNMPETLQESCACKLILTLSFLALYYIVIEKIMYFSFLVSTFFVRYAENLLLFDGRVEDTVADLLKK